ncbi:MAG: hypothetical protein H0U48_04260 [Euzebyaceae bacterium]|jgi:hypothetical protein|nr:hypothetical protein [Euzebyaceae bacterium]
MADDRAALDRLLAAAAAGALNPVCERFGVEVFGAFGSATDPRIPPDLLGLGTAVHAVCGPAEIELLDLRTAEPIATTAGLVGGVPLYEHRPGVPRFCQRHGDKVAGPGRTGRT